MSEPSKSPTLSDRYWRLPWLVRIGLVIGGAVAAAALFGVINRAGLLDSDRPTRSGSTSSGAAAQAPAALPAGQIGEGVWFVGSDVQPGTYRSTGSVDGRHCLWSRHDTAAGGPMDGIIASDGSFDGQMVVTIEATDVLFRTNDCAPFAPVG